MAAKHVFLLVLQLLGWQGGALAQRGSFSLQAAVDELHRREAAKYPLNAPPPQQSRFIGGAFLGGGGGGGPQEQDYWDDDSDNGNGNNNNNRNRHKLNKILAKYLERESYDADHGGLSLGPFGGYEFDEDNNKLFVNYPDEKKRSSYFRERDNKYDNSPSSVFRERDSQASPSTNGDHAELTEQFLREIEESQELDREERYKEALRRLWEKYQQQENELDGNLFDEQKRMVASSTSPNYYIGPLMQKKRSYPVLPWLPYSSRKKRFPVAKRSTKRSPSETGGSGGARSFAKTDEKVARELSELFGSPRSNVGGGEEKKKRSTDEQTTQKATTTYTPSKESSDADMRLEGTPEPENATHGGAATDLQSKTLSLPTLPPLLGHGPEHGAQVGLHHEHCAGCGHHRQHRKRSDHHEHHDHDHGHDESHEEEDESGEEEHDDEHDDEEDDDEHEDFEDDEEGERKRKRDVASASSSGAVGAKRAKSGVESIGSGASMPGGGDLSNLRRKKSIQWSKYFGLDRKKKSVGIDDNLYFAVKKSNNNNNENNDDDDDDDNDDNDDEEQKKMKKKKKRDFDPEKLENMDKKLQSIEDLIIDETIKYTGAHEGIANPDEIRRLKDHVLSRLATAYSLEKMRRALEKLRQSVDNENHLLRNVIESEAKAEAAEAAEESEALENQKKRLSVKKEKVQFDGNHLLSAGPAESKVKEINSNAMMSSSGSGHDKHTNSNSNSNNDKDDNDDDDEEEEAAAAKKKQKKKRNGYLRYPELPNDFADFEEELGAGHYESLNDAYLGNKNYIVGSNQCPVIESMAERCRGVDLLSGDIHQELLPICGVHQICYLCGTSQVACDYQYLAEADSICGHNNDCQAAARSVLMILRGSPGPQLGPRECLKNSCLYSAMREIGL